MLIIQLKLPSAARLQPSAYPKFQTETDYIYFRTFQERTAVELTGYFETCLWDRAILQVCHEEEFALHGVIAIGALHTTLEIVQSNKSLLSVSEAENKLGENHHHIACSITANL
jgi:hypothetical protein